MAALTFILAGVDLIPLAALWIFHERRTKSVADGV